MCSKQNSWFISPKYVPSLIFSISEGGTDIGSIPWIYMCKILTLNVTPAIIICPWILSAQPSKHILHLTISHHIQTSIFTWTIHRMLKVSIATLAPLSPTAHFKVELPFWPYKNKIRSCHFLASACLQLNPKPSPKPCIKWPWSSLWFGVLLLLCLLKLLVILASLLVLKHAKYAPFSGSLPCFPLPGKCSPQYPVGVALSFRSLLRCHHGRVPSLLSLNWKPLHCISLHSSLLHIIA